ncbi:AAA family ATPase [Paenibacillus tarimensis]
MRIESIHIDGFGKWHDLYMELGSPVTVLYGPNEAGKSTILGFVRSMLYGFATRANMTLRQEPVAGGRHGGRLIFTDGNGVRLQLERYAAAAGQLTVRSTDGLEMAMSQAEFERRYMSGISERLFRQLFAVSLSELQEVGALKGEELGRYLYHAGWSGGKALATTERRLRMEMESIYRPRGVNQPVNQLVKSIERIDSELRQAADSIEEYNRQAAALSAAESELEAAERELPIAEERLALLVKACDIRPLWLNKIALDRERERLTGFERLPQGAELLWEKHMSERSRKEEERDRLLGQMLQIERELEQIEVSTALLAVSEEAERLALKAESMDRLRLERVELSTELRAHEESLQRLLARISPDWTERDLEDMTVTVADREFVRSMRASTSEIGRECDRLEDEFRRIAKQADETEQALLALTESSGHTGHTGHTGRIGGEPAEANGAMLLPRTKEELQRAWDAFERVYREWELEAARAEQEAQLRAEFAAMHSGRRRESAAGRAFRLVAAAVCGAALMLALGAASGLQGAALWGAAAGAAALALALSALAAQRRSRREAPARPGAQRTASAAPRAAAPEAARLQEREQRVSAALAALLRQPQAAAGALLSALPAPRGGAVAAPHPFAPDAAAAHERLRDAVAAQLEAFGAAQRSAVRRKELELELQRLLELRRERGETLGAARLRMEVQADGWRAWLAERRLPGSLSPEAALEVFDLAEQGQQRLQARCRAADKIDRIDGQWAGYKAEIVRLCEYDTEADRLSGHDPSAALKLLLADIAKQKELSYKTLRLEERRSELAAEITSLDLQLSKLNDIAVRWFTEAGASDENAWTVKLEDARRARTIDEQRLRYGVEIWAGMTEAKRQSLEKLLLEADGDELLLHKGEAQKEADLLHERRSRLLEQLGRQRQSIEELTRRNDRTAKLTERERNMAELEQYYDKYAVLLICQALLQSTKAKLENEREPEVLKAASRYLSLMTGGAYSRIAAVAGQPKIRLETKDLRVVEAEYLSRGAAEQLYLAMRFALSDVVGPSLPILLDDVFVNFDSGRLGAAVDVLKLLSVKRQIILLTCHPHVKETVVNRIPNAQVIPLH